MFVQNVSIFVFCPKNNWEKINAHHVTPLFFGGGAFSLNDPLIPRNISYRKTPTFKLLSKHSKHETEVQPKRRKRPPPQKKKEHHSSPSYTSVQG